MEKYGTKPEHLAAIAISQRDNAILNDRAVQRKPLTIDDYMSSRMIVDPFHLYDMALETDGACALLVTSSERAKDVPKKKRRPSEMHADRRHLIFKFFIFPPPKLSVVVQFNCKVSQQS